MAAVSPAGNEDTRRLTARTTTTEAGAADGRTAAALAAPPPKARDHHLNAATIDRGLLAETRETSVANGITGIAQARVAVTSEMNARDHINIAVDEATAV